MENATPQLKVLYAASEALPLIKTGGLADVAGSLPAALRWANVDARLVLPAYPQAVELSGKLRPIATTRIPGCPDPVRILEGEVADQVPLYLVDAPGFFDRRGNPYTDRSGRDWVDNAWRFSTFCRTVVMMAMNRLDLGWHPDLVHTNDWQTGLISALLAQEWNRPATVFTVHNLSYQGLFDRRTFDSLHLPVQLWSHEAVEFHDKLSFIKGGLAFADWITTVSPTYARQILDPAYGYGLEGLLAHRQDRLAGILNGIDYRIWDPSNDPHLIQSYDHDTFDLKHANKAHLQRELGLVEDPEVFLVGHIGRVVEQKGVDLILEVLPRLMERGRVQVAVLGSGAHDLEEALRAAAARYPGRVAVQIGYNEPLAHRIEAGADAFVMPSRFEPCGLNQIYSLRYGTVPIVHRTGGLADTVVDASPQHLLNGAATGFVFDQAEAASLWDALERAMEMYHRPGMWWRKLASTGMDQDFSWPASAARYIEIYHKALNNPAHSPV